jgi:hypothetical protein
VVLNIVTNSSLSLCDSSKKRKLYYSTSYKCERIYIYIFFFSDNTVISAPSSPSNVSTTTLVPSNNEMETFQSENEKAQEQVTVTQPSSPLHSTQQAKDTER